MSKIHIAALFASSFLLITTAFSSDKEHYIAQTQQTYEATVYPYFDKENELKGYLEKKYHPSSDMWTIWNAIEGLEGLDNNNPDNQTSNYLYSAFLLNSSNGMPDLYGAGYEAKYGVDFKKAPTFSDRNILMASAIYAGLNEGGFDFNTLSASYATHPFLMSGDVKGNDAEYPALLKHKAVYFAFLLLAGKLEMLVNWDQFNNIAKKPNRHLLQKQDISDANWNKAVDYVKTSFEWHAKDWHKTNMGGYGAALATMTFTDKNLTITQFLNHFKDRYLDLFIPIANLTNDRKHGIVRPERVDHEEIARRERALEEERARYRHQQQRLEQQRLEQELLRQAQLEQQHLEQERLRQEREAAERQRIQAIQDQQQREAEEQQRIEQERLHQVQLEQERIRHEREEAERARLEAEANKFIKDKNIILSNDGVGLKVIDAGSSQSIFDAPNGGAFFGDNIPGGAKLYQKIKRTVEPKMATIVVPFLTISDTNNDSNIEQLLKSRKKYLLMEGPSLALQGDELAAGTQELQNLYNSGNLYIFSTDDPIRDGVYAYIPAGTQNNAEDEFRMIAKPAGGDNRIGSVLPNQMLARFKAVAKALSAYLNGGV